jgi:hypothetical protein
MVMALAIEAARFSAPSEQKMEKEAGRSYSYSYSAASYAMESDRDGE